MATKFHGEMDKGGESTLLGIASLSEDVTLLDNTIIGTQLFGRDSGRPAGTI